MNNIKNFTEKVRHSYYGIMKVIAFILALVVVVWMMPRNIKFKYEFQKLRPWQHETLYAPFDFPVYKTDEALRRERDSVRECVKPVFKFDAERTEKARAELLNLFENEWNSKSANWSDSVDKAVCKKITLDVFNHFEDKGIIEKNIKTRDLKGDDSIWIVRNNTQSLYRFDDLFVDTAYVNGEFRKISDKDVRGFMNNVFYKSLNYNVVYSEKNTEQARKQAAENVLETHDPILKDEFIIAEGEIVTDKKYQILTSLQREYTDKTADNLFGENYVFYGQLLLLVIVFFALYMTLKMLRPDIFEHLRYINLILLLMLFMIVPSFLLLKYVPTLIYLMPVAIMAMLLMTFFDARISMVVQIITLIIISLAVPNPFQYFFVQLLVSLVAVFSMTKRSSRASYFGTSIAVFITYVVVYLGMMLIFDGGFDAFNWRYIVVYAGNAFFTVLSLPLAFLFERVFGFVTDLSLLELSNTNSTLLRKLASEAPGTFQHAMQVADLCEEVIYNIGGNPMLARTGAMYHDIGKMKNPFYFIENQNGKYNPHDDVSNSESAQIIISHVIDGIEICRKYHIPEQIIDFVRTHHGTRRTEYFYQMELRENPDGVDESEFCYPGPLPFSKETAVLMMCDAVEAASRSMKEKTEESLNKLVDNIIDGQMKANQFDNTNITFHDITVTKKVLKKKLMSIYHVRIEYPD